MTSEHPLVCICIPTFNAEKTIQATLLSLLQQTYQNIVIYIFDNCSTDNTLKMIGMYPDARIKIFNSTENIGAEANFNRCIDLAIGEYTAIYHADDIYEPEMVQQQVDFLKSHTDVAAVFTEAKLIDQNAKCLGYARIPTLFKNETNVYHFSELLTNILKYSNFLICPSAMVKTKVYKNDIMGWRGNLFNSSADLDVWLRIALHYAIGIIPKPLMHYRLSHSQWSEKLRRNINRSDFFQVIDFYLEQDFVKPMITKVDLINYQNLERRDRVMRAVNLFLHNRGKEAIALCHDVLSFTTLKEAVHNRRGKFTLLFGFLIRCFMWLKMESLGRKLIWKTITKLNK